MIGIVSELLGDTVTHLTNPSYLLVAFVHWNLFDFFIHKSHLAAPRVSPALAHTSQAGYSPGEYARTYWRSPSAGSSRLPETRTCGKRPTPSGGHRLQDPPA